MVRNSLPAVALPPHSLHAGRKSLPSVPLPMRSSRTGHLNVITDEDMICIAPQARIPPELALIDRTLEDLEGDKPDWDIRWRCDLSDAPRRKRA